MDHCNEAWREKADKGEKGRIDEIEQGEKRRVDEVEEGEKGRIDEVEEEEGPDGEEKNVRRTPSLYSPHDCCPNCSLFFQKRVMSSYSMLVLTSAVQGKKEGQLPED